jgi:hypothetical protein
MKRNNDVGRDGYPTNGPEWEHHPNYLEQAFCSEDPPNEKFGNS